MDRIWSLLSSDYNFHLGQPPCVIIKVIKWSTHRVIFNRVSYCISSSFAFWLSDSVSLEKLASLMRGNPNSIMTRSARLSVTRLCRQLRLIASNSVCVYCKIFLNFTLKPLNCRCDINAPANTLNIAELDLLRSFAQKPIRPHKLCWTFNRV